MSDKEKLEKIKEYILNHYYEFIYGNKILVNANDILKIIGD